MTFLGERILVAHSILRRDTGRIIPCNIRSPSLLLESTVVCQCQDMDSGDGELSEEIGNGRRPVEPLSLTDIAVAPFSGVGVERLERASLLTANKAHVKMPAVTIEFCMLAEIRGTHP